MNEEDYSKVFSILVNGDHAPLLDAVVDNPQIRELSLRDAAGVDTTIKTVMLHDKIFKLQLFEFSNQEQFRFLRSKFKPDAKIIVYDATAIVSFHEAQMWLAENASGSVCIILVGNDHNLNDNDENKVVKTDTGKELARRFGIHFRETSAENQANLEQALIDMTQLIFHDLQTRAIQMEG